MVFVFLRNGVPVCVFKESEQLFHMITKLYGHDFSVDLFICFLVGTVLKEQGYSYQVFKVSWHDYLIQTT